MINKIPVIDDIGWFLVKFSAMILGYAYQVIGIIAPPKSLMDKVEFMQNSYSAWYVFGTKKEDLPAIVQDIYTQQGRKLLALIIGAIIISVVLG